VGELGIFEETEQQGRLRDAMQPGHGLFICDWRMKVMQILWHESQKYFFGKKGTCYATNSFRYFENQ
jgi:hypothetical protein